MGATDHGYQQYFFCVGVFVMSSTSTKYVVYSCVGELFMGTTGTKYTSYVWVVFCNGYHGYQVCPVLGCGVVAIYGYQGYQVCFFCVGSFL